MTDQELLERITANPKVMVGKPVIFDSSSRQSRTDNCHERQRFWREDLLNCAIAIGEFGAVDGISHLTGKSGKNWPTA
jgi:hypothetical protein